MEVFMSIFVIAFVGSLIGAWGLTLLSLINDAIPFLERRKNPVKELINYDIRTDGKGDKQLVDFVGKPLKEMSARQVAKLEKSYAKESKHLIERKDAYRRNLEKIRQLDQEHQEYREKLRKNTYKI